MDHRDQLRAFVGPPLRQTFARFGVPEAGIEEAIRIFRARYVPIGKFENAPYPGIEDLLRALRDRDLALCVATSKPQVTAVEVLEHFHLAAYFDEIAGADPEAGRETKADVLTHLLARTGSPRQAVMVGDTDYDVLGAKAHGIPTIGVTWGYGEPQAMVDAGALALATTPGELLDLLGRQFGQ